LGGLGIGYIQQVVVLVAGLWLTPFLLAHLGEHQYGAWLIISQLTAYLSLLDLGVVALLPRETAAAVGRGGIESPELQELVGRALSVIMLQLPVVAVCALGVWYIGRSTWRYAESPLGLILIAFVMLFPFRLYAAVLQGLQDLAFVGRSQLLTWAITTAMSIALVLNGAGIMALAISSAVSQVTNALVCWYRLRRRFPGLLTVGLHDVPWPAIREYMRKSVWISTSQVGQVLTAGSDVLLVGKFLGASATVPYSCTGRLAGVLANKPQMLMQVAFPGLSELRAAGSRPQIRQATMALSQAMLAMSGAVACVVLAVNHVFVDWWIGAGRYGGNVLSILIVLAMFVRHWNVTLTYSLFCFGYERRLALTGLADGCVSIVSSALLIPHLGLIGVPIGALIGVCLVNMPANLAALSREMEISSSTILGASLQLLARLSVAAIGSFALGNLWSPRDLPSMAVISVFAFVIYGGLVWPVLLRDPLGCYVRPKLRLLPSFVQRIIPAAIE
jgi:O-antigen/teichoic acid export membrane protein